MRGEMSRRSVVGYIRRRGDREYGMVGEGEGGEKYR